MPYGVVPPRFYMHLGNLIREDCPSSDLPLMPVLIWQGQWVTYRQVFELTYGGVITSEAQAEDFLIRQAAQEGEQLGRALARGRIHALPNTVPRRT